MMEQSLTVVVHGHMCWHDTWAVKAFADNLHVTTLSSVCTGHACVQLPLEHGQQKLAS